MKTQIKDIVIGIFAVIGFTAVVMGFTNETEPQQTHSTPESHVWEMHLHQELKAYFTVNKVTGEVRAYDLRSSDSKNFRSLYYVSTEINK
mgnify:FL=1|jgi:hypothetical protein